MNLTRENALHAAAHLGGVGARESTADHDDFADVCFGTELDVAQHRDDRVSNVIVHIHIAKHGDDGFAHATRRTRVAEH